MENTIRFLTDEDIEVVAVTAAQMTQVDRVAVNETGPQLLQMMENAGRNLAELVLEMAQRPPGELRVVVLAGGGGNGGGGICAARHLANHGAIVRLFLAAPHGLGEAALWQRRVFTSTPGREIGFEELSRSNPDVILDALIGYSLAGAPTGAFQNAIVWANGSHATVIALDVPSGLDATTGEAVGVAVTPSITMTLALPKTGLTSKNSGALVLADIGIPIETYRKLNIPYSSPFGRRYRVPIARASA